MLTVLIVIAVLLLLYVLSTVGRVGHPGLQAFRGWAYTHRGLYGEGVPENSLEAFAKAKEAGYGTELDVHLLADGDLAVIHDSDLKRVTGREGLVEDLTGSQLKEYTLEGTDQTIPRFEDVLKLFDGKVPLIVELKSFRSNHAALCKAVCEMLDRYEGPYCLESFDPLCVRWLRKNRPEIVRGQLYVNYLASSKKNMPWIVKFFMSFQMVNFLVFPDFVAYKYKDRKIISNTLARKLWGLQGVTWTVQSQAEFDTAVKEGWIPIFEGFKP